MQTSSDLHFFDLSERREKKGQQKIKAKLKFRHLKSIWIQLKPPLLLAAVKARPTTATWGAAAATISPLSLQCRGSPGATGDGRRGANAKLRPTWASAMVPVDLIVLNLGILYVHICCLLGFVMTWIWDEGDLRGGSYIIPSNTETFTIQVFPQDSANTCLSSQAKVELPFLPTLSYSGWCDLMNSCCLQVEIILKSAMIRKARNGHRISWHLFQFKQSCVI